MFVPIDALKPILADLVKTGRRAGTAAAVARRGGRRGAGPARRLARVAGGPGDAAGIKVGDIILGVGGDGVRTQAEFYRKVWSRGGAGTDIPLRVLQGVDVKELVGPLDRPHRVLPAEDHVLTAAAATLPIGRRARSPAVGPRRMRGFRRPPPRAAHAARSRRSPMLLYAATIFVSAFLLFLVQPVMAKQILPWFGGSAAVWTTCLVFFQTALLAGYAYSDLVVHRLAPRAQMQAAHGAAARVARRAADRSRRVHWKPTGTENPSWLILGMLVATIGLPYFLLSTTSPLVQAWFARARPGASPYRLFALSNLASMLALVGYPFLLEPWAPTRVQALGWSAAYALFVGLCAAAGWSSLRASAAPRVLSPGDGAERDRPATGSARSRRPAARQALWCALAATGSLLLLAVSNHITQNIAAVPLLWIVPLAIYLLTFILCFDGKRVVPAATRSSRCSPRGSA